MDDIEHMNRAGTMWGMLVFPTQSLDVLCAQDACFMLSLALLAYLHGRDFPKHQHRYTL